eukprot:scaffold365281_cov24-Attheya_sp.AAC.1
MLGRELNGSNEDRLLLCLERVRILDLANAWATSTLDKYSPYFTRMYRFEAHFGVSILVPTPLLSPPWKTGFIPWVFYVVEAVP